MGKSVLDKPMANLAPLIIGSLWTPYGLSDDPFFQAPLQAGDGSGARPMTLFVGRDDELRILANQVVGSMSSRAIVEGAPGVGKTTFVNRLKTELARHGVLTHAESVRITPRMSPRDFVGEVLKALLQMYATLQAAAGATGLRQAFRRGTQMLQDEVGLDGDVIFWRRISRLIAGEDSVALGVAGGQRERVQIPAEVKLSLFDELAEALRRLSGPNGRRVLVHVGNLETLTQADACDAARLMQNVRDVFLADWGHWLFVGTTGIADAIFRPTPQVSSIIGAETQLRPLTPPEVAELLRRRYRHLHLGKEVAPLIPPLDPDTGAALYARYHGHLRAFLMLASRAVHIVAPGVPLGEGDVIDAMAPWYWETLVAQLGIADAERLRVLVGGRALTTEFRVADIVRDSAMTQSSASKLIRRLERVGVIIQTRTEGRSTFYQVRDGDATIALAMR